uniref:UPF0691 protein C9orf116 homolog isoform X2 n=1 Tax=Geotrypetes seraphini TaxID=260995 RepID=A0A6P8SU73_GEOSA|nr:UPF0691 protein C9orf116 homolog isoform X2 [Geotrypetes seraphini]
MEIRGTEDGFEALTPFKAAAALRYIKTHPVFRTSNQTYGNRLPTVHEMPTCFNSLSSKFSTQLRTTGMYRNHGFNTIMERSDVTGTDNFITFYDRLNFHKSYNMNGPSFSH